MRTIRTKVYSFDELSEEGKQTAINQQRNNVETDFIYDEAHDTVKAFNELFNLKKGNRSWLDADFSNTDEDIQNLKGLRLQKYIWNNFGATLFKKAYLKHGELRNEKPKFYHRMRAYSEINQGPNKGLISYSYYSNWKKDTCCVLTGVCYDNDMLDPIYQFLEKRDFSNCTTTYYHLINDCFKELDNTISEEVEFRNSDEAITEDILANDNEFTKNGNLFFNS